VNAAVDAIGNRKPSGGDGPAGAHFGSELRRRRQGAGLSLRDLATRVHYTRGYLSKIENGHRSVTVELARLCDSALGAGGALIAAAAAGRTARGGPDAGDGLDKGRRDHDVTGRSRQPGDPAELVPLTLTDVAEGQLEVLADALQSWLGELRVIGQRTSPRGVLRLALRHSEIARELAEAAPERSAARLWGLAARYVEYAGWLAQEAGDDQAATWLIERAVEYGEAAADQDMAGYALVRRALIALYQGDSADVVLLAQRAGADSRTSARVRGLAAAREAQGHALAGAAGACDRSLDRARRYLADAAAGAGTAAAGLVLGTSTVADPAAMTHGWCLYELGRPAQAVDVFDREIMRLPDYALGARTRYGVRRALAYAASGEVDHACALTQDLLPAVPVLSSATIQVDLRGLVRALNRWPTRPAVRDLRPELSSAILNQRLSDQ